LLENSLGPLAVTDVLTDWKKAATPSILISHQWDWVANPDDAAIWADVTLLNDKVWDLPSQQLPQQGLVPRVIFGVSPCEDVGLTDLRPIAVNDSGKFAIDIDYIAIHIGKRKTGSSMLETFWWYAVSGHCLNPRRMLPPLRAVLE
jgi:hypothetical protein